MQKVKFVNIDKDKDGKLDHFLAEFTYKGTPGAAALSQISVSLDGEKIPLEKIRLKIGEGDFQSVHEGMFVSVNYGERITLEVTKNQGLKEGKHSLNFRCETGYMPVSFVLEGVI